MHTLLHWIPGEMSADAVFCALCSRLSFFAVLGSWAASMKRVASDPFAAGFMTISNDPNNARSFPKGSTEIDARTIKPKVKDFDEKLRITGIPGFNFFGTPSSKQQAGLFTDLFKKD